MSISEQIQEQVQKLPPSLQREVLHFIEYLLLKEKQEPRVIAKVAKAKRDNFAEYFVIKERRLEDSAWSELSLASAMRGMEDEETPVYTMADLKVVFFMKKAGQGEIAPERLQSIKKRLAEWLLGS
jgi:hypothetical protein